MKRRVTAILLIMVMILTLGACGNTSGPSQAVEQELKELQTASTDDLMSELNADQLGITDTSTLEAFLEKVQDFDYEIGEEKIADDEETATVEVTITTYDFGSAFQESYTSIYSKFLSGEFDENTSEDDLTKELFEGLTSPTEKNYSKEVTVNCTKDGDTWSTDLNDNSDFMDAIFGGLISGVDTANEDMSDSSDTDDSSDSSK